MSNEPLKLKKYRVYPISFGRTVFVTHWLEIRGKTSNIILHDGKEYEYIESNNPCDGTGELQLITKERT